MLAGWKRVAPKLAAYIIIVVNTISVVFAVFLFAISLWIIASPSTLTFATQIYGTAYMRVLLTEDTLTLSLGVGLAVISALLFFMSFMGIYGACNCSQFLLFMYSTLVLLLLLLECALFFYFSTDIVQKGINEQDGQWVHILRLAYDCCEHNLTSQDISPGSLPWSCCGVQGYPNNCTADKSFGNNCQQTFTRWLDVYETPIYVGLTVFHVILSSCSLLRRACSTSRSIT